MTQDRICWARSQNHIRYNILHCAERPSKSYPIEDCIYSKRFSRTVLTQPPSFSLSLTCDTYLQGQSKPMNLRRELSYGSTVSGRICCCKGMWKVTVRRGNTMERRDIGMDINHALALTIWGLDCPLNLLNVINNPFLRT